MKHLIVIKKALAAFLAFVLTAVAPELLGYRAVAAEIAETAVSARTTPMGVVPRLNMTQIHFPGKIGAPAVSASVAVEELGHSVIANPEAVSAPAARDKSIVSRMRALVSSRKDVGAAYDNAGSYKGDVDEEIPGTDGAVVGKTSGFRSHLARAVNAGRAVKAGLATLMLTAPALAQEYGKTATDDSVIFGLGWGGLIGWGAVLIVGGIIILTRWPLRFVPQSHVAVIKQFGRYKRIHGDGPMLVMPWESVHNYYSLQNQTHTMAFELYTSDPALVKFKKVTLVYSLKDATEDTLKNVAFKFIDEEAFLSALEPAVEGSIRAFVANTPQGELQKVRATLSAKVKEDLDQHVGDWGYVIRDIQINDIEYTPEVQQSMDNAAASKNRLIAAENDGQATLKKAEYENKSLVERAKGAAGARDEIAKGMRKATDELKGTGLNSMIIPLTMYFETLEKLVQSGKGNTFFFDGSVEGGLGRVLREMQAMMSQGKSAEEAAVAVAETDAAKPAVTTAPEKPQKSEEASSEDEN